MSTTQNVADIELVAKFCHGYNTDSALNNRWRNLYFEPNGVARVYNVFGWILGIHQAGMKELAEKLASSFLQKLDYLNEYGGNEHRGTFEVPQWRVVLTDDGTLHGFSVLWYHAMPKEYIGDTHPALDRRIGNGEEVRYAFKFNGGFLYHGPGGGEVFAVTLSPALWSIHT